MKNFSPRKTQPWMLALALLASAPALHAATTDIYTAPPQAGATGVKPNIMFLLDDSGSMSWDHLPDNVGYGGTIGGGMGGSGWYAGMCRLNTSGNTSNVISQPPSSPVNKTDCFGSGSSVSLELLKESGVPYFAKEFNGIFYNPTITYTPPVDYDGTNTTYKSYTNVTAPFMWSTVKVDPFPDGNALGTVNVQTAFPEQIFCDGSQSGPPASFDAVHCRRNLMTNPTFSIGLVRQTATTARVTLANHGCQVGDTVTISGATLAAYNGAHAITAIVAGTSYDYAIPNGTGLVALAAGKVFVSTACNIPITKLSSTVAGSFTIITAVYPIPHGCNSGELVTFKALPGTNAGYSTAGGASVTVVDERTLTYSIAFAPPLPAIESSGGTAAFVAESSLCAGTRSNYSTSTTVPPLMQGFPEPAAGKFITHILLNSNPHYFTIGANEYCTDDNLTTCQAPVSETIGGVAYTVPAFVRYCGEKLGNAASVADVNAKPAANIPSSLAANAETGCHRVFGLHSAPAYIWPALARYGYFTRVDIVNTTPTYPKAASRSDCSGAVGPTGCSYNQEMTNVANWYAYYRTRIQMVKSSAALAFKNLSPNYRVGFNSLNAAGAAQWLPVAPFDTAVGGQKSTWFTKLNAIVASGGTKSRNALSRVGRYYGGLKGTAAAYMLDDPIEASCQQNFVFFATDGFWNSNATLAGSSGIRLDGSDMLDQDCAACTLPIGHAGSIARPFLDAFNSTGDDNKGTLADVAYYYYNTDLRDATHKPTNSLGLDVTLDDVPASTPDPAKWQHMSTFTMGLGLESTLIYRPGYATPGTAPDYDSVSGLGTPPFTNWPAPVGGTVSAVDDLWHAAVNGHGTYFSARDPTSVVSGMASSFAIITQRSGVVAAPATSNPVATQGDNFVFNTTFTTLSWYSQLSRRQIDPVTGAVSTTPDWTAQAQLDTKTTANSDNRNIYTFDSANAATHLRSFAWANLTLTEQGYFNGGSGGRNLLGQWFILSSAQQNQCDTGGGTTCGQKLVNYLRGQRGFETTALGNNTLAADPGINSVFRHRDHIFGDSVNAQAVYVKFSPFGYGDPGYVAFKSANLTRQGTVYVAANDGMLHAFNADTGAESWAYVPTMVMPNMWHLADFDYANNHRYFVDGTPVTGDICTLNCTTSGATWKTILVGGLNDGGRGFYALDITDPASPKALWELKHLDASNNPTCVTSVNNTPLTPAPNTLSDCDIGLSFGNPIITKRSDGKWVVLVTSGYNNVSPGTGGGYLYIVDPVTGAILNKTATLILNPPGFSPGFLNAGNTTTPSGFTRINAFVANASTDNTTLRVYGGDLNGNLWRIDAVNAPNTLASSPNANVSTLLAILGTPNALKTQGIGDQPITTKPELGEIMSGTAGIVDMVYVGTGRFLGSSDVTNTLQQSFYGIKDPLGTFAGWNAVRTNANMVKQTLTVNANGIDRTTTANSVTFSPGATGTIGWFIDFNPGGVSPGERNNTDPTILFATLFFTTNAPNSNTCDFGGKGYLYFLDYTNGGPSPDSTSGLSGTQYNSLVSGPAGVVYDGGNKYEGLIIGPNPDQPTQSIPFSTKPPTGGKRINWRELNF